MHRVQLRYATNWKVPQRYILGPAPNIVRFRHPVLQVSLHRQLLLIFERTIEYDYKHYSESDLQHHNCLQIRPWIHCLLHVSLLWLILPDHFLDALSSYHLLRNATSILLCAVYVLVNCMHRLCHNWSLPFHVFNRHQPRLHVNPTLDSRHDK